MLNNPNRNPLSKWEFIAAYVTRTDPELLHRCSKGERIRVVHEATWIIFMFIFLTALWSTVLSMCGLGWQRVLLAAVLVTILLLFEISLTATDTNLRGILHSGRHPRSFYVRIGARLAIASLLNFGAATAFDMWLMRDEALQAESRVVDNANRPIRKEYEERTAHLRKREVEPFENRIAELSTSQAAIAKAAENARNAAANAFDARQTQDLERYRQDEGYGGRNEGHGVLARDAERQAALAAQRSEMEDTQRQDLLRQAGTIETALTTANHELALATARFNSEAAKLTKERDSRLLHLTDGPLTIMRGWLLLRSAPDTAAAVFLTTTISWLVLMLLETAFFLSRVAFRGEQLHDLYLLDDLRRAAMQVESDLRDEARGNRRRPPLRVVPGNDDNQNNANQGE